MKQLLFVFAFCISSSLLAEIVEVKNFSEVRKYTSADTLVILDIENTLLMSSQELGSDQWFSYRLEGYRKQGKTYREALEVALPEWEAIQNITTVELVEADTPAIIEELQRESVRMIGLTTRSLSLANRTIHQLKLLGIDLSITAPSKDEIPLLNPHAVLYRGGILFTAGTHKGRGLQKLLAKLDYKPKKVVFINDKRGNLRQVEEGVDELSIPYVGLRYGYLDDKVRDFRADVADLQFKSFCEIMSDTEAEKILNSRG